MKKEQHEEEKTNVKLVVVTLVIYCIIAPILFQMMVFGAVKLLEWGILMKHPEWATEYAEEDYSEEDYVAEDYVAEDYVEEDYSEEEYVEEDYSEEEYVEEDYVAEDYAEGE